MSMVETMDLVQWDKISSEIAEAKDIAELSKLYDKVEFIKALVKKSNQSLEVKNQAALYGLEVNLKIGEWCEQNLEWGGDRKSRSHDEILKLRNVGLDHNKSYRCHLLWRYEQDIQEDWRRQLAEIIKAQKEITTAERINAAKKYYRLIKIAKQRKEMRLEPIEGLFDVIVIDPPWPYANQEKHDPEGFRGTTTYPEMSMEELKAIELPAKDDCVLWLWTTNNFMKEAYELLSAWEFEHKSILTWNKEIMGTGKWLRNITEHCILAIKGKPYWENTTFTTLLSEKRQKHSEKPEKFYEMVDKICAGSRVDYFARRVREGWICYGDEVVDEK